MMERIPKLVQDQYDLMNLEEREKLTPEMRRVLLKSRCKQVVFDDWQLRVPEAWDNIEKLVDEMIPDEEDQEPTQ